MWVIKYEYECIKNMEWLKAYKICINTKQTIYITLMLPFMINQIDEMMDLISCHAQT